MFEFLHWILFAAAVEMVLTLGVLLSIHAKHGRTVGKPQHRQAGSSWRTVALLPATLAVLLVALLWGREETTLLITLLVASAGCVWFMRCMDGATLGDLGARVGWRSRRFAEFEEWRLTGDHARFRLRDQWLALELAVGQHDELRQKLESECAGRESRFKD